MNDYGVGQNPANQYNMDTPDEPVGASVEPPKNMTAARNPSESEPQSLAKETSDKQSKARSMTSAPWDYESKSEGENAEGAE
jgi:hypothetical protein